MITIRKLLLRLILPALCRAEIIFKSPAMGEVIDFGPYKIRASDNGVVPTLGQFYDGSWEVVLFTGNNTAPFELWEYKLSGYQMKNPTTQSPPVNIRRNSTLSLEDKFFFGYRSYLTSNESIWVTTYSDRFTLTNMTGTLPDVAIAANNNVTSKTAPRRTISCGAKAGGTCDQKVLESLGLAVETPGNASTNDRKILSGGAIAGIVIGAVAAVFIAIAVVMFIVKRIRKRKMMSTENTRDDKGQVRQELGAFHVEDTSGVIKKNGVVDMGRRGELEGARTYEMSADHHRLVEMPENP